MNTAIYELLRSDSTIYVSRPLAKAIGLNEAILYSALLSKENYYESHEQLDDEGMFYSTAKDLEKNTALTAKQQKLAIDKLIEYNLIESKLKGVPAKKWFKVNKDVSVVEELIQKGKESESRFGKNISEDFPLVTSEDESETSGDERSNQVSTFGRNKDIPKVETRIYQRSKQDCTKGRSKCSRKVETIINNKNNKKNTREKDNPPKSPKGTGDEKTLESVYRNGVAEMSAELKSITDRWLKYKQEKHGKSKFYKPTGLEQALSEIRKNAHEYGDNAVIGVINQSMANNYIGIVWDWLSRSSLQTTPKTSSPETDDIFMKILIEEQEKEFQKGESS